MSVKTNTDLKPIIDKKEWAAKYMVSEITHIIKSFGKRAPGSEGEKDACEYMAKVLRDECGCEDVKVESFSEHPGAFYGWRFLTITFALVGIVLLFFSPLVSLILYVLGFAIMFLEFGFYKQAVDFLFRKRTSHNVTAVKKCTGAVERRIFFNGHPDAAWEWPVNYKFGGAAFEAHAIVSCVGALYYLVLSAVQVCTHGLAGAATSSVIGKMGLIGLIFVPFLATLYMMNNEFRVVDGANDNLTACYMGIAILKAMRDAGVELEHTEVGVLLTGSEEAGLRGAKAWSKAHEDEYKDVPTFFYSYDTIHDPKYLMVNYRDLNATVKSDAELGDLFMDAAAALDVPCSKGIVPPLGGSTDAAAFAQAGRRAIGVTGLNHNLENYYHTRRDTYDNMNEEGLENCYAVSVKVLEMFDAGAKQ
ncbi:MAG: M20/M25/M40 family metallo-hydrolase [Clostridia bacterium]|nr:M20/M25/M40 family metallo-hydrolase [Clostridia bacterium]